MTHVQDNGLSVCHATKGIKEKLDVFFRTAVSFGSKKSLNNFGRNFCRVLAAGIVYSDLSAGGISDSKLKTRKKPFFHMASKKHNQCLKKTV